MEEVMPTSLPPTAAQLAARNRLKRVEELVGDLVRDGVVIDTGKRRWCEATGRVEIVWDLAETGPKP
jgi:hypothetical protein